MSTALALIVLGHAFNNTIVNSPTGRTVDPGPAVQNISSDRLLELRAKRYNYVYTPTIGAHKLHTQKADWNTARKICKEEGGHLAIINSVAESELFGQLITSFRGDNIDSPINHAHIGFHDLYATNEWTTIHDESLTAAGFSTWASGEPSRSSNKEHCGSVYRDGKLNDMPCDAAKHFICELPSVALSNVVELSPQFRVPQTPLQETNSTQLCPSDITPLCH